MGKRCFDQPFLPRPSESKFQRQRIRLVKFRILERIYLQWGGCEFTRLILYAGPSALQLEARSAFKILAENCLTSSPVPGRLCIKDAALMLLGVVGVELSQGLRFYPGPPSRGGGCARKTRPKFITFYFVGEYDVIPSVPFRRRLNPYGVICAPVVANDKSSHLGYCDVMRNATKGLLLYCCCYHCNLL